MDSIYKGQLVAVEYETRQLKAIVIDPNGFGANQPTIGLGMRMSKEYVGIPHNTLSDRVVDSEKAKWLKLITDEDLRVVGLLELN